MFRFFLLAALVAVAASATDYCSVCTNHTMCLFKTTKAGSACKNFSSRALTDAEKKAAVDAHNSLRNKVATGKETRGTSAQPKAADMRKMVWNDELATIAQRWAIQCKFEHDKCRNAADKSYVGQNIHWAASTGKLSSPNFASAVQAWYDEVDMRDGRLNTRGFTSQPAVGHYTQVVWAKTFKVGCAFADYTEVRSGTNWNARLTVCNYGPGGNVISTPMYTAGEPARKCPSGTKKDTAYTGLCA